MGRAQKGRDSWERPARRGGQRKRQVFVFAEGEELAKLRNLKRGLVDDLLSGRAAASGAAA